MTTNLPSKRTWHDIGSDINWIDYGGHWARRIDDTRYHVIRFDNLEECTGEAGAGYHVQLSEVNILPGKQMDRAIQCCGLDDDFEAASLALNQVYALASYGAAAPLESFTGRNAQRLMRQAKAESRRLSASPEAYEAAMDRPVNKIGSTAREYAAGDVLNPVLRGLDSPNPWTRITSELMLKLGVR